MFSIVYFISLIVCQTILETETSFIDKLYGELVYDNYIQGNLPRGFSKNNDNPLIKSTNDQIYPDLYYETIFNTYLNYRKRVNYPDKDDTSDISIDQNMFGGILTYAHLNHFNCFNPTLYSNNIDIAIVGAPFDTGVSYRPGARFGPNSIRDSAKRLGSSWKSNKKKKNGYIIDPYDESTHNFTIIDCGDIAMIPFDNRIALNQLYRGQRSIFKHKSLQFKNQLPKFITMGGDHTISLMNLKNLNEQFQKKIRIFHFDSHIDTWDPKKLGGGITNYMSLNHGTFLHYAHELGYIEDENNYHIGIRAPYIDSKYDKLHDSECGFHIIKANDIDKVGIKGIIQDLKNVTTKEDLVYISVDIDVLDPAYAPGTGTMETGGFTTRELISILDGLKGSINLIGADVVEVSPPFDSNSGITSLAATAVIDSFLKIMMD
ncbi:unnamed protein product [Candida verbasci]|uniref:Agmatinase n=1 Tax=Candida verbasci TaxID=1227364 RepID=A0A9W4TWT7_9ASCO|nr:unnamed protein product [Candida verbasci]